MASTNKKISMIVIIPILLLIFSLVEAAEVVTNILQYKLDRLYFPAGKEENVYPGNRFTVYSEQDSIYGGIIEASLNGVSYSTVTRYFFDTVTIKDCRVIINSADIDSTTDIVIGLANHILPESVFGQLPPSSNIHMSANARLSTLRVQNGNRLFLKGYESEIDMVLDFETGKIDGFYSQAGISTVDLQSRTVSSYMPFFAALVPNVSKSINESGLLSKSLYHRFDKNRLSLYFDGDNIKPCDCLYPIEEFCSDDSEFDPEKAQAFLHQLDDYPKKVRMFIGDIRLNKLGRYYADVLSRNRIKTEFVNDKSSADIYLLFLPISVEQEDSTLSYIINLLSDDSIAGSDFDGLIDIMTDCLQLGRMTTSSEARDYYYRRILKLLNEDIGVYPLFRPTIFFTADSDVRGFGFDPDGNFNIFSLAKIKLPSDSGEIR